MSPTDQFNSMSPEERQAFHKDLQKIAKAAEKRMRKAKRLTELAYAHGGFHYKEHFKGLNHIDWTEFRS